MSLFGNFFSSAKEGSTVPWKNLEHESQLDDIIKMSKQKHVIIFKHSTTCSISMMAKSRLERGWNNTTDTSEIYYLDLLSYRSISNKIASIFEVTHESPQILVIKDGKAVYHTSHNQVNMDNLRKSIGQLQSE